MRHVTLRPSERSADAAADLLLPDPALEPELPFADSPPLLAADVPAAATDSRSGVTLQVSRVLDEVEREWTAFERHADRTVFQTFAWVAAWQRHVGARRGTIPVIVLGRESDGRLLFILPLAIETSGPVRRLAWLGSGLCDYNAPLLAGHFSDRMSAERFVLVWGDILALLGANERFRFDLIDLQKMPEMIGAQRNPFLDLAVGVHPSGAYVASLDADWETFYAARRSASTRKRERRQLKHLAESGDVRLVDVAGVEDVAETLATLIAQKSRAFARMGVEDLFGRPGYRDFYLDVTRAPALRESVHVSRLDVGTLPVAANVGLQHRDCYYLILSSYDDGELARFGPGRAHLHELIRRAIGLGFRRFDFTVGDEPYKRDWADVELRLHDHLAAATLRGHIAMALVAAFRRTKRFIKQSPTLWPVFSKARALVSRLRRRFQASESKGHY
jgi:CelD/BcsL family acetyltransferase involved in cellulose biosynthesis